MSETTSDVTTEETTSKNEVITDRWDVTTLRAIDGWDEAMQLLTEEYGIVEDATQVIGSGFALMSAKDKARLVDERFLVMHVMFPESSEHKDEDGAWLHYAVAHIITSDGRKLILTDGGTGIYRQLEEWVLRSGRRGGLMVPGGLRESVYDLPDGSGKGTTYYLAV